MDDSTKDVAVIILTRNEEIHIRRCIESVSAFSKEVFVVDSCYRPSSAAEDIAQIRQWTSKPVGFLLNTHFHNDHNNGNRTYLDAFPSLAIIAQEETKKDMDLIQPGNVERAPKEIAAFITAFKQGKGQDGHCIT